MAKKDKGKGETPTPSARADAPSANDETEASRRIAFLRHKLTKAMDDPLTRDQIVKAIRSMMADEK